MNYRTHSFIVLLCLVMLGCREKEKSADKALSAETPQLTEKQAKAILQLPLHCIEVEYPNKLGQTLGSEADLKPPKTLRPIFYGCFDWHSAVHGYWSIVKIIKKFPKLDADGHIRATLNRHITAENAEVEKSFFEDPNNLAFERTYGWAWLLKLQSELITWDDPDAKRWSQTLQPLVDLIKEKLYAYLPDLVYPVRHGKHENTAFGLSLMYDYASDAGDRQLQDTIASHAQRLYQSDVGCDLAYEPSGSDFLSPCLEEAALMSRILPHDDFKKWMLRFLPSIEDTDFSIEPAVVKDRSDGQLVHLDGLNYSRAACLYAIYSAIPEWHHLKKTADEHILFSLPNLSHEDDYMGSHWLGTFALYALAK